MRPSLLQHPREFQTQVAGVPTTPTGYHQWHRSYAAELGRFVGRDPVGFAAGVNLYEYVWDSPTNRTDPTGEQFVPGTPNSPYQPPGGRWPFPPSPAPTPSPRGTSSHGNYCGGVDHAALPMDCLKNPNRPTEGREPRNALDLACYQHDCCIGFPMSPTETCTRFLLCNRAFCRAVRNAKSDPSCDARCQRFAELILGVFLCRVRVRVVGLPPEFPGLQPWNGYDLDLPW